MVSKASLRRSSLGPSSTFSSSSSSTPPLHSVAEGCKDGNQQHAAHVVFSCHSNSLQQQQQCTSGCCRSVDTSLQFTSGLVLDHRQSHKSLQALQHTFMSGCSTALLNPARCILGSSFFILLSTARRISSGVLLPLLATKRIRAGSSRCSCSSRATPRASKACRAGRTMSKLLLRSASTKSATRRGSSSGMWGRRSSRRLIASSASICDV